jgi:uncharacterized protein YqgV (UPF0045/DUF77 family)
MTIGCQFSLYPMTDRFIEVIMDSIADLRKDKLLTIETDDLSTMLQGPVEQVFSALENCFARASAQTGHVVMNVTFSHGCPGESGGGCCKTGIHKEEKMKFNKKALLSQIADFPVSAQFALYPLNMVSYMDVIYREIKKAEKLVSVTPKHYCTRLDGPCPHVFQAIAQSLVDSVQTVPHVVVTAVISKGSPTVNL